MPRTRLELEELERRTLAPYAQFSADTRGRVHPDPPAGFEAQSSSLEAQVANLADEITYYSHDLDDGLDSGLLDAEHLGREVRIWGEAARTVDKEYGPLNEECRRYFIIRCIIDGQVKNVVHTSEEQIAHSNIQSADDARRVPHALVQYSPERKALNLELRDYLYRHLYYNPEVHEPNQRAVKMLEALFHYLLQHPDQIGEQSQKRAGQIGMHRAICDYLSGMTDRYAMQAYQRLCESENKTPAN